MCGEDGQIIEQMKRDMASLRDKVHACEDKTKDVVMQKFMVTEELEKEK